MIPDGGPGPAARVVASFEPSEATGAVVEPPPEATPTAARSGRRFGAPALRASLVAAAGVAAIALGLLLDPPRRASGEDVYTIPSGTADRVSRGLPVDDVLPARIETEVGRALVVINQDTTDHVFGPMVLAPGQRWERRFAVAGDYALDCSVYPETGFTIGVDPGRSPNGPATVVHGALTLGWLALAALVAGWLGLAAAAPIGPAAIARARARSALGPLSALAVVVALAGVAAMSRVVPWSAAWSGPQSVGAWFGVGWVLVAGALAWRLLGPSPAGTSPKADYVVLAAAALLWPAAQAGAGPAVGPVGLVLALGGAGILAALAAEALRPAARHDGVGMAAGVALSGGDLIEAGAIGSDGGERSVRETSVPAGSSAARWEASTPWLLAAATALVLANLPATTVSLRVATGIVAAALAAALLGSGWRRAPWPPARRMVVALALLAVAGAGVRLSVAMAQLGGA